MLNLLTFQGLESKVGLLKWRKVPLTVRDVNDRLMMAERALTNREGLLQKEWYKHLVCSSEPPCSYCLGEVLRHRVPVNANRFMDLRQRMTMGRRYSQASTMPFGRLRD